MNTKEITAVGIKFFAFWLLINTVSQVPKLVISFSTLSRIAEQEISQTNFISLMFISIFIGFISFYLLWKSSNSILNSIPSISEKESSKDSHAFLIQLGGVYFIISSVSAIMRSLPTYFYENVELTTYLFLVSLVFEFIIGLTMLINSKGWVFLINRFRGRA
jgi:hypothetical protein